MSIHDGHREKMRQRFLTTGLEGFADHEALELLLYYALPRRDTNPIAHALLERFGSLERVLSAPAEELQQVEGIGPSAAALLRLAPQLTRKAKMSAAAAERVLDTSERIGTYFVDLFTAQSTEVMYQLCLDAKGKMLSCHKLGEGDISSVGLNLRRVVENALRSGAVLVALAHNHPSGLPFPSPEDRAATERAKEALDTVGVRLADHIIVADDDFISMRQSGML